MKCTYHDCDDGMVKGLFGSRSECATCNGSGLLDAETGEALPDREIVRQLLMRYSEQKLIIHEMQSYQKELQKQLRRYERGR